MDADNTGSVELPNDLFDKPTRPDLLHRVVQAVRYNKRQPVAHTKDRRDRKGGGKKPWRQKGTGRARHGSIRSPLWKGGGVTFGPRNEKKLKKKINQKEKGQALASALSAKNRDNEVFLIEELEFDSPNTSQACDFIESLAESSGEEALATRKKNALLVITPEHNKNTELSFRNFGNMEVTTASDVNALDLLTYKYVAVIDPETVFDKLKGRIHKEAKAA